MAWKNGNINENPYLEYDIYLKQGGEYILKVYRFLTLDSTGRIRFEICVDDNQPVKVETDTRDEWMGKWQESVFDNGEKIIVKLPYLSACGHF